MRIARYSTGSAPAVIGIMVDGHVYALADLVSDAPQDMCDLIADWERRLPTDDYELSRKCNVRHENTKTRD